MYMILSLNKEKYLDDVLMALTEAGIDDTIVLSGESLGRKLTFDNPIFAGFRKSFSKDKGDTGSDWPQGYFCGVEALG